LVILLPSIYLNIAYVVMFAEFMVDGYLHSAAVRLCVTVRQSLTSI